MENTIKKAGLFNNELQLQGNENQIIKDLINLLVPLMPDTSHFSLHDIINNSDLPELDKKRARYLSIDIRSTLTNQLGFTKDYHDGQRDILLTRKGIEEKKRLNNLLAIDPDGYMVLKYLNDSRGPLALSIIESNLSRDAVDCDTAFNFLRTKRYADETDAGIYINDRGKKYISDYDLIENKHIFNDNGEMAILSFLYGFDGPVSCYAFPEIIRKYFKDSAASMRSGDSILDFIRYKSKINQFIEIDSEQKLLLTIPGKSYYENMLQLAKNNNEATTFNLEKSKLEKEVLQLQKESFLYQKTIEDLNKKNLEFQNNSLEYQKTIRALEEDNLLKDRTLKQLQIDELKSKKMWSLLSAIGGGLLTYIVTNGKEILKAFH